MGDDRFSNLVLMSAEARMVKQFDLVLEELIDEFASLKSRRSIAIKIKS